MSNFKLEFKLIQHTPIIHFQSYQDGATLRATELKPKLDKFLLSKNSKLPKSDKDSLNYKVKITSKDNKVTDIKFVTSNNLKINFFSFNSEILKAIKENFSSFLAINNFGARQKKGYGSFSIKANNE